MSALTISRTPAANDPISAQFFEDVFADIEGALSSLDASNLSNNAGITRNQIADRFTPFVLGPFMIVPLTSGSDLGTPVAFDVPNAAAEIWSHEISLPQGVEAFLCEAQVYCAEGNATDVPLLSILKNGALVAGAGISLDSAAAVTYRAPPASINDPYASPFMALRDGDEFTVEIERGAGAGTASCRGVWITLYGKAVLIR